MKIAQILPGTKVDIYLIQKNNEDTKDKKKPAYRTAVFDAGKEDSLDLVMPIEGTKLQILPKNIRFEFDFYQEKDIYVADGIVTDHIKKGIHYLMRVKFITPLKKIQRREYFRMECYLPLSFLGVDEKAVDCKRLKDLQIMMDEEPETEYKGTLLDISGGGARFIAAKLLEEYKHIFMRFQIQHENKNETVECVAEIICTEKMQDVNKYVYRVKFKFKEDRTKDLIIRYIFDEQRRIRKKELGI